MSLEELADNEKTDKNTVHAYLPLYQSLLEGKKDTAKNVLEIGIKNGGSIKLWSDFFTNATVYAIDIQKDIPPQLLNNEKIVLYMSTNAYDEEIFKNIFLNNNIKYDFILDDGPHTLDSMIKFIKLYSQIITDDGILMIEDVQSWDWIDKLKDAVPEDLKKYIKTYDLRNKKNRWDDIVFTIDKQSN